MNGQASRSATRSAFFLMTLLFALYVMPSRDYPLEANAEASPEKLARGVAATPYQYRILVPWVVRQMTPDGASQAALLKSRYWAVEFTALVALGLAFRRYLALFVRGRAVTSVLALSLYAILPFNYRLQDFYPYDVPSVLFFTVGLILIYERRWSVFYPVFVLATLNRETSIFLALVTAFVWFDRQSPARTAMHVLAQCLLWLAIKWWLFDIFRDNPQVGYGIFQPQLKMNLALILRHPLTAIAALSTWAYLWIPLVVRPRTIEHPDLRRTLWLIPVVVAAMLWVGVVNETRIYGELLPVVLAGAIVVFVDFMKAYFEITPEPLITRT